MNKDLEIGQVGGYSLEDKESKTGESKPHGETSSSIFSQHAAKYGLKEESSNGPKMSYIHDLLDSDDETTPVKQPQAQQKMAKANLNAMNLFAYGGDTAQDNFATTFQTKIIDHQANQVKMAAHQQWTAPGAEQQAYPMMAPCHLPAGLMNE